MKYEFIYPVLCFCKLIHLARSTSFQLSEDVSGPTLVGPM